MEAACNSQAMPAMEALQEMIGRWIEGFCSHVGVSTSLEAELHGIKQALKLAKNRQWELVDVESDLLVAVKNINVQ